MIFGPGLVDSREEGEDGEVAETESKANGTTQRVEVTGEKEKSGSNGAASSGRNGREGKKVR